MHESLYQTISYVLLFTDKGTTSTFCLRIVKMQDYIYTNKPYQ